jgi:hypothetical protein
MCARGSNPSVPPIDLIRWADKQILPERADSARPGPANHKNPHEIKGAKQCRREHPVSHQTRSVPPLQYSRASGNHPRFPSSPSHRETHHTECRATRGPILASQTAVSAGAAWLERESMEPHATPPFHWGPARRESRESRTGNPDGPCGLATLAPSLANWSAAWPVNSTVSETGQSPPVRLHQYYYAVPPP